MTEPYIGPIYEAVGPVTAFHDVPRFGNISDITSLFSAEGLVWDTVVSYVLGTIFIGGFLLASYFVFISLIFLFKCCCRGNKSRVFAGLPFIDSSPSVDDNTRGGPLILKIYRSILLFATFVVVVSGFVFLVQGTQQFQSVADDIRDGTQGFIKLSDKVTGLADSFIAVGNDSTVLRDSLIDQLDDGICNSFEGGNANPLAEIDDLASELVTVLDQLQEFAKSDVIDIKDTFGSNLEDRVNSVEDRIDLWQSILNPAFYAGPAIGLGFIFMIGIILAWVKIKFCCLYFCIQTWIILPFFFIFFTASILTIAAVGTALVANADVCIGNALSSPEGFMDIISKQFLNEPTQAAVDYYLVSGCRGDYVQLIGVEDTLFELGNATQKIIEFNDELNANKAVYEAACGGGEGSFDTLSLTLDSTLQVFENVEEIGQNTTDLLTCEDINRIWVDLSHDAFCTSSPYALAYMFGTMTAIYIAGMLIFLMRGALLPETLPSDREVDKNEDIDDADEDIYDKRPQDADDNDEEESNESNKSTEPLNKDTNKNTKDVVLDNDEEESNESNKSTEPLNKDTNKNTKDSVLYKGSY